MRFRSGLSRGATATMAARDRPLAEPIWHALRTRLAARHRNVTTPRLDHGSAREGIRAPDPSDVDRISTRLVVDRGDLRSHSPRDARRDLVARFLLDDRGWHHRRVARCAVRGHRLVKDTKRHA